MPFRKLVVPSIGSMHHRPLRPSCHSLAWSLCVHLLAEYRTRRQSEQGFFEAALRFEVRLGEQRTVGFPVSGRLQIARQDFLACYIPNKGTPGPGLARRTAPVDI